MSKKSGNSPFTFSYCEDLRVLPDKAAAAEENLHGGFAVDKRPGYGHVYYGMPNYGLMKVSPDLTSQETIELPPDLKPLNFHSTKIGMFDGNIRLLMPANNDSKVAVLTIDGNVEYIFEQPEFDEYQKEGAAFHPTDLTLIDSKLYVADGYGANYISIADLADRKWSAIFGGKTHDPAELGKYGTAHGLNPTPEGGTLAIADRPHSRFEIVSFEGEVRQNYTLPAGSKPCGIDYMNYKGKWYAAVGSLDDPQEGRPAPIYILDAQTYRVLSTIRAKDDLGVKRADHIHNVVWHEHNGDVYLVCQAWNPGYYFVLKLED
jgi:hypothetical protein